MCHLISALKPARKAAGAFGGGWPNRTTEQQLEIPTQPFDSEWGHLRSVGKKAMEEQGGTMDS
jgi:hypothetical protein